MKTLTELQTEDKKNHHCNMEINLKWEYPNPPIISNTFQEIEAQHKFILPEWMGDDKKDCIIDIAKDKYGFYFSRIWWFNRGIRIVTNQDAVRTLKSCIKLVEERISEFSKIF